MRLLPRAPFRSGSYLVRAKQIIQQLVAEGLLNRGDKVRLRGGVYDTGTVGSSAVFAKIKVENDTEAEIVNVRRGFASPYEVVFKHATGHHRLWLSPESFRSVQKAPQNGHVAPKLE